MDLEQFLQNNGMIEVPNPDYNNKSKKKGISPTIQVPQVSPINSDAVNMAIMDFNNQTRISEEDSKKYAAYGLNFSPFEDMNKNLANKQSTWKKWGHALAQTLVSEIGIGTIKGASDLVDFVGSLVGVSDGDYTNPVSKFLEEKQEEFKKFAPIYRDESLNIANGGLLDAGWWTSNIPSIASSLTLLIPAAGVTGGIKLLGKATGLGKFARNTVKGMTGVNKAIREGKELSGFQRLLNNPSNVIKANTFAETGLTAAMSRTMENYQEGRQVYQDVYANASDHLRNRVTDEEYQKIVNDNADLLQRKGVDTNDRDAVAKAISEEAADATFRVDWGNVVWDVLQVYALRNAWKGPIGNTPRKSAASRRADLDSRKFPGKTPEQIAEIKSKWTFGQKAKEWSSDRFYAGRLAFAAEASEGAEEALNYVAQEEGMTFGNVLLNKEDGERDYSAIANMINGFDGRLTKYVQSPELYDAAFWGVLGGIVFQGLGSKFNRIKQKLYKSNKDIDGESQKNTPWYMLDELPEVQRQLAEINGRVIAAQNYKADLDDINKNIDIYNSNRELGILNEFTSEEDKEAAKERLFNEFITNMGIRSMHAGTLDMLKAYIADDNVRKGMIELGLFNDENNTKTDAEKDTESKEFMQKAINALNKVEDIYNQELITVDNAAARLSNNSEWKGLVPAEYIQAIATENTYNVIGIENYNRDLAGVDARIGQLETQFQQSGDLDSNVNHRENVKVAFLGKLLGQLRAERKDLVRKGLKDASDRIALQDIDKQIKIIEDKIEDSATLNYVTFLSLRYNKVFDSNGKFKGYDTADTAEAIKYFDETILKRGNSSAVTVAELLGLEDYNISEKARKFLTDEEIQTHSVLAKDSNITAKQIQVSDYTDQALIDRIGEEMNELSGAYATRAAIEIAIDNHRADLARTTSKVDAKLMQLHNTMSIVRQKAIDQSNATISDLYKKYKDEVKDYINSLFDVGNFDENNTTISAEDMQRLKDSMKVLNLTSNSNRNLYLKLMRRLDLVDEVEVAQNAQNTTNQNQSQSSNNQNQVNPTPQPQNPNTQAPSQSQSQPQGNNQQPTNQNQQPQNPAPSPAPNNNTTFSIGENVSVPNKGPGVIDEISGTTAKITLHDGSITFTDISNLIKRQPSNQNNIITADVSIDNNGKLKITNRNSTALDAIELKPLGTSNTYLLNPGSNLTILTNQDLFISNANIMTDDYQVTTYPQIEIKSNGEVNIVRKGEIEKIDNQSQQGGNNNQSGNQSQPSSSTGQGGQSSFAVGDMVEADTIEGTKKGVIKEIRNGNFIVVDLGNGREAGITIDRVRKTNNITPEQASAPTNQNTQPQGGEELINQGGNALAIFNQASDEFLPVVKNALQNGININFDDLTTQIINNLINQGNERSLVESQVNQARSTWENIYNIKKNNIAPTLHSSVDEVLIAQSNNSSLFIDGNIVEAYDKVVKTMLNRYAKEAGREVINGKTYINLEELLRYINNITGNSDYASMLYDNLLGYLNDEKVNKDYIIEDLEEAKKANFLENVLKSAEERYREKAKDDSIQRVDIKSHIEDLIELHEENAEPYIQEYFDAIDSLQPGDALTTEVKDRKILIKNQDGKLVGTLPIPGINTTTGAYEMFNDGWKTDILPNGEHVKSKLKDYFKQIFDPKNNITQEVYDIILEYSYGKPDTQRKQELLNKFINNTAIQNSKTFGFTVKNPKEEDYKKMINGLVKLMRFNRGLMSLSTSNQVITIDISLDDWFDKLYNSYDAVIGLSRNQNYNITVNSISDGELIISKTGPKTLDEAIAGEVNPDIQKVGVVDNNTPGNITTSGHGLLSAKGFRPNQTYIVIPNRSGRYGYAQAYPIQTGQLRNGAGKEIAEAVKDKLTNLIIEFNSNPSNQTYNNLKQFVLAAFQDKEGNTNLFYSKGVNIDISNNAIIIGIKESPNFIKIDRIQPESQRQADGTIPFANQVTLGDETYEEQTINNKKYRTKKFGKETENFRNIIRNKISQIVDKEAFAIRPAYVKSDNDTNLTLRGLATRENGKFVIKVGDKSWIYNSFNEFFINNRLAKVNIEKNESGTSNFERFSNTNQAASQVFEIKITRDTSFPVEENTESSSIPIKVPRPANIPLVQQAKNILNSDSKNKVVELYQLAIGTDNEITEENLKILQEAKLLPKNIIFDKDFNNREGLEDKFAAFNPKTRTITVGELWLDKFKKPNDRNEAIRKLIHEQIHYKLNSHKGFVRSAKEIYDEFERALENPTEIEKLKQAGLNVDALKTYLFKKFNEDVAVEDFLVESLTSKLLAKALNIIDAENKTKEGRSNLFKRILDLLSKMFNWGVREGSLYEKELNTLREIREKVEKQVNSEKEIRNPHTKFSDINKRYAEVYEQVKDNQLALETLQEIKDGIRPKDIYEAAAIVLSRNKLMWKDEGNRKGVASETGYGQGERRKLLSMLATREKGGKTIAELAEDEMKEICRENGIDYDNQSARNALIDILQTSNTAGINRYVYNNRFEQALQIQEQEDEYYRDLEEEAEYNATQEQQTQEEEIIILDDEEDSDFDTDNSNDFLEIYSSINESVITQNSDILVPSVQSMQDRLPLSEQAKFGSMVASAEISVSCK